MMLWDEESKDVRTPKEVTEWRLRCMDLIRLVQFIKLNPIRKTFRAGTHKPFIQLLQNPPLLDRPKSTINTPSPSSNTSSPQNGTGTTVPPRPSSQKPCS